MKDALPSLFVFRSYEDSKGYVWFLTHKSITRFDGKKSWIIGPADGYSEGGAFYAIEDAKGQLWFITKNFRAYVFKDDKFYRVKSKELFGWVDIDASGVATLLSREGNVYGINPDLTVKPLLVPKFGLGYCHIKLSKNSFLVATHIGVNYYINTRQYNLLPAQTYINFVIPRLFKAGNRVFISNESGLFEFKDNKAITFCALKNTEVYDVVLDSLRNCFWVGTSSGLLKLSLSGAIQGQASAYISYPIMSVSLRRDHSLWIATSHRGMFIYHPDAVHYSDKIELDDGSIAFVKRESDKMYFFNNTDFIYRVGNGKIEKVYLNIRNKSEAFHEMIFVKAVSDTEVYFLSHKEISIAKGKISLLNILKNKSTERTKGKGKLIISWNGTSYGEEGDIKIKITARQYSALRDELTRKNNPLVHAPPLLFSGDTSYMAAEQGALKVYWKNDRPVYKLFKVQGLITQVIADSGEVFVSTENNGIYMFKGKETVHLNTDNLLLSNYCSNIYLRRPYLWATTNNGLFRINLLNGLVTNFTANDYLMNSEVNDIEFFHDSVFVATIGGVTIFPEATATSSVPPSVYLEKMLVNNVEIPSLRNYTFDYLNNNISMFFSSPGYRSASFNKFRLIITGNGRTDTSYYNEGNVQLFALMPGTYDLVVNVMDIDGLWSTKPVKLAVTITPPFWKTWWFICLIVASLMGIAGYVVWVSLKRQKEIQNYTRKLAESELKSLRLYMNPHFLFNSLTSLQSFILTRKTTEANNFITKFSRLIRAVMTYSIKGELKLQEELELLKAYLELESVRFSTEFEYTISADPEIDTENTIIPSLIIQPFVENAIKHGVTGLSGRRCYIRVHFFLENNNLYCTIADNGKGRKGVKKQDKLHVSSGIKFTEERIKLLISENDKPVITITDTTTDETMPGTTVKVLVPVLNLTDL